MSSSTYLQKLSKSVLSLWQLHNISFWAIQNTYWEQFNLFVMVFSIPQPLSSPNWTTAIPFIYWHRAWVLDQCSLFFSWLSQTDWHLSSSVPSHPRDNSELKSYQGRLKIQFPLSHRQFVVYILRFHSYFFHSSCWFWFRFYFWSMLCPLIFMGQSFLRRLQSYLFNCSK